MAHRGRRQDHRRKTRKTRPTVQGTLRVMRPGHAVVDTPEGTFAVARRGLREGMSGDTVQVSLVPMHGRRGDPVAYVQGVVQRACSEFVGTYDFMDPLGVVSPLDGRLGHDFFVLPEDESVGRNGVRKGDVVRARIVEYPTRASAGVVTIEQRLGTSADLDLGVEGIIASHGLSTEFGSEVLAEAEKVVVRVGDELRSDPRRKDLREVTCVTIDPADARDFDDAVGAREVSGGYELDVHIADVTHYLPWGCAMDREAQRRACSTYLVDRVLPMLPERLCNDVCSLRPNEDRLAMTVRMRLDKRGEVLSFEACPSAIRSQARLSYDEVDRWLEDGMPPVDSDELCTTLSLLDRIAQLRLDVRARRGAIDFETTESKVHLDDAGRPTEITLRRRTRATSLVEEAMLLANECVAKMLAERDLAAAYRVHERPAPEDLKSCVPVLRELDLLREVGEERLVAGDPFALQEVLATAHGTGGEFLTNALLLRAQKRAIYLPHNEGHYALGARAYCHFTSPIRRYPDVLVHRALKRLLAGLPPQGELEAALPQLCRTCSDRERVADAAARESQQLKIAQYYAERIGERYGGVVVGCERFGLFVMLDETGAEGLLPTRALGDEWYVYDAERMCLIGESTGRVWRPGKRVAVCVAAAEPSKGQIDFVLA
ncbi:MAG: ribonuclease R [Atopobiaceae bacterium]|nr:ribonuclease R [Atopobiaceae bacterium]MBR3315585.1 ribonuclease R [Atopobiaceae bacterium]